MALNLLLLFFTNLSKLSEFPLVLCSPFQSSFPSLQMQEKKALRAGVALAGFLPSSGQLGWVL